MAKGKGANNNIQGQLQQNADYWNRWAQDAANQARDYGQNNPYSQSAEGYIGRQLQEGGNMGDNPWMSGLYEDLQGVNQNEANTYLRDYLGPNSSTQTNNRPGGGGGAWDGGNGTTPIWTGNPTGGSGGWNNSGSSSSHGWNGAGGGGNVPDTVGNSDSYFAQRSKELFDPARLDPANDPTMQPYIEAMRRENERNLLSSLQDMNNNAEAGGRFGGGLYQAMNEQTRGRALETLNNSIAQSMMGAREAALGRQMQGLQDINQRDIAAMNDATQRYGIDTQASSAAAGSAAAAADAAAARKLQAIGMLQQGAQFGMGMRGDMAQLMSQNQLGALNAGQGYAGLGLQGINTGINAGQLGVGAMQGVGNYNIGSRNAANAGAQVRLQGQMNQFNMQQGALNNYLNILGTIGGLGGSGGGTSDPTNYQSGGMPPWVAALGAGLSGGGTR